MPELVSKKVGEVQFLLGNEAIVRGTLESGVHVATTYPGTPSSEIGDILYKIGEKCGIQFEYSINEKVALEVASGAALVGAKAICSMKHVGVNVAADPLITLAYMGFAGALVLVSADDPGCHSSQNEQDNRLYAKLANIPMFEPSNATECKEFTKVAFEISKKYSVPVILRTTTRVNHERSIVKFDEILPIEPVQEFKKDPMKYVCVPVVAKRRHVDLLDRMSKVLAESEGSKFNFIQGSGSVGIVTSGVSYNYVYDLIRELGISDKTKVLKLGFTHPLPDRLVKSFLALCDKVIVVEELEPYLESFVREKLFELWHNIDVYGKTSGHFPFHGEYSPDIVRGVLAKVFDLKLEEFEPYQLPDLPARPPNLCVGCPHRATFYAIKAVIGDGAIYPMDIGCYSLGFAPPLGIADYLQCMGASVGGAGGIGKVYYKPAIGIIGDSTFFHSGITGLINAVYNRHKFTLVIADNRTTAMTGHQPHPGVSREGAHALNIEDIVRASGVKCVEVVNALDLKATMEALKRAIAFDGVSVVISKGPCLFSMSKEEKGELEGKVYFVDQNECRQCTSRNDKSPCNVVASKDIALLRSKKAIESGKKDKTTPSCVAACPTHICIPGYVADITKGRYLDAIDLIREQNPLPSICGYVCHHPCEESCVMQEKDQPVSIKNLKAFLHKYDLPYVKHAEFVSRINSIKRNGKKVAVIGSGPAGLGAAYELFIRGYEVTVFEGELKAGGMLRFAIPEYRLPRKVLDTDIKFLTDMGIKIKTGSNVSPSEITKMQKDYAAIVLAIGMQKGMKLGIKGEDREGVYDAISFLKLVNSGDAPRLGQKVFVVGGGDSAIDAARSVRRLGSKEVTILYRRGPGEMPARQEEIDEAFKEGVAIEYLVSPVEIISNGGLKVVVQRMALGAPDASGRRRPVPKKDDTYTAKVDNVIIAIGQELDLPKDGCVRKNGRIVIDGDTRTSLDNVYSAGDCVTGSQTVVEAIAGGRLAAYHIDMALSNGKDVTEFVRFERPVTPLGKNKPLSLLDGRGATREADRCIVCGTCAHCNCCTGNFACGAFYIRDGRVYIDEALCTGCGVCAVLCPSGAIKL